MPSPAATYKASLVATPRMISPARAVPMSSSITVPKRWKFSTTLSSITCDVSCFRAVTLRNKCNRQSNSDQEDCTISSLSQQCDDCILSSKQTRRFLQRKSSPQSWFFWACDTMVQGALGVFSTGFSMNGNVSIVKDCAPFPSDKLHDRQSPASTPLSAQALSTEPLFTWSPCRVPRMQ